MTYFWIVYKTVILNVVPTVTPQSTAKHLVQNKVRLRLPQWGHQGLHIAVLGDIAFTLQDEAIWTVFYYHRM